MKKMADSGTMSVRKSSWILFICGDLRNVLAVQVNNVEESTVGDLKSLIEEKSGILANEQKLFLGEVLLSTDALKLQDVQPELKDGSSISLVRVQVWHLTIQDRTNKKSVGLKVAYPQDVTIAHLKHLVQVATKVVPYEQKLIHMEGGTVQLLLEEEPPDGRELLLHDYPGLGDGSTIILMHLSTWKLHVEYPQGKSFTLQVSNPEITPVSSLKNLIQERTGLLPRKQALNRYQRKRYIKCHSWHFQDHYYPLDDDQMMLCECPLEDKATIRLGRFPGWHLYIRMVDGNTTMITLENPEEVTVPDLKVLIEKRMKIPDCEQRLSHNHTILEDIYVDSQERVKQRYLRHYLGVGDESVLCLVRLTGTNFKVTLHGCSVVLYMNFVSNDVSLEALNDLLLQKTHHQYTSFCISNYVTLFEFNNIHIPWTVSIWSEITSKNGATLTLYG